MLSNNRALPWPGGNLEKGLATGEGGPALLSSGDCMGSSLCCMTQFREGQFLVSLW